MAPPIQSDYRLSLQRRNKREIGPTGKHMKLASLAECLDPPLLPGSREGRRPRVKGKSYNYYNNIIIENTDEIRYLSEID